MKRIILTENEVINLLEEIILLEAMSLDQIYTAHYSEGKRKEVPEDVFYNIANADPTKGDDTMGDYTDWMIRLYRKGDLKKEDLPKATEYLKAFHKFKKRIEKKDIGQYKSLSELGDAVQSYIDNPDQATSKSDEIRRIKARGAELVYEDEKWVVIVPKTEEAAIYYGKGTKWCTAATETKNYFNFYNNDGPLYININKQTGEKFQFHFESSQFKDESDIQIKNPIAVKIGLTNGLIDFYTKKCGDLADKLLVGIKYKIFVEGLPNYQIVRENKEDPPALFKCDPRSGERHLIYKAPNTNYTFSEKAYSNFYIVLSDGNFQCDIFDTTRDEFIFMHNENIKQILTTSDSPYVICFMHDDTISIFSLDEMDFVTTNFSNVIPLPVTLFESRYDNKLFFYFPKNPKTNGEKNMTFITDIVKNKTICKASSWTLISSVYSVHRILKLVPYDGDENQSKVLLFDGKLMGYDKFKKNEHDIFIKYRHYNNGN